MEKYVQQYKQAVRVIKGRYIIQSVPGCKIGDYL